ncbi:MAG: hypothetical protein WD825_02130 [Gemmatimonadaceae bacterium]
MTPALSPARRRFLEFLVGVAAVHVVAIALYYALDLSHAPARQQRFFAWGWMAATIAVVFAGLQRIKRARRRSAGNRM